MSATFRTAAPSRVPRMVRSQSTRLLPMALRRLPKNLLSTSTKQMKSRESPPQVLLYGRVPLLLETRRMVLASAGLLVLIATDIDEVKRVIVAQSPCGQFCSEEQAPRR